MQRYIIVGSIVAVKSLERWHFVSGGKAAGNGVTEKFIHNCLKATWSQLALWNSRALLFHWCCSPYLEPSKPCLEGGSGRGTNRQGYNLAPGPNSQECLPQKHQKVVEVWESSANVLMCQETLRWLFSQHTGAWPGSRKHQQSSLPWYFKGRSHTDKSCPTLPTAHTSSWGI